MTQIRLIGVVGAGNMGSGIAQKLAQEGLDVIMVDTSQAAASRGLETIRKLLGQGVERRLFTREKMEEALGRISCSDDLNAVKDADLVIEAIFEDKAAKRALFAQLDKICHSRTILATNTSSFYVSDFADELSRPDRFVGLHYFYHPAKNRLLEVVPGDKTSAATLETALTLARLHGKTPIVVKDAPGFAVNRFFVPFLNEAVRMLEEGVANQATIEAGAMKAFGIGMGPFELMNVTGIPIAVHAATTLGRELGPFYAPCGMLISQMEKSELWPLDGEADDNLIDRVVQRFLGVCFGVAASLVDEGVASIEDTDRGAKIGLRWRLGPFELMNKLGIEAAWNAVKAIVDSSPGFAMPRLLDMKKQQGTGFDFNVVDFEVKQDIGIITINRPEAMNALNEAVFEQLDQRFDQAESHPGVKTILIQGAGKAFVAGADIRFFIQRIKAGKIQEITEFTRRGHEVLRRIETSKKRTLVLLDGLSLGGGSELALAAQAVIATPAASMGFPETGIGIYPGLGGMLRFARCAGPELARWYTFTGLPAAARDLFDLGIAARLVDPSEIWTTVREMAEQEQWPPTRLVTTAGRFEPMAASCTPENTVRLLEGQAPEGVDEKTAEKIVKLVGYKAPLALRTAHEIIEAQQGKTIPEAIEIELSRLETIFSTRDALEGLSSAGRRRPEFTGD